MSRVEDRLFAGATLTKTLDQESPLGCFWTFSDGSSARSDICEKLLADGMLEPLDAGLFPDTAQTYRLAPYRGEFDQFATERFGPGWFVCERRTPTLKREHPILIKREDLDQARREFEARKRAA